MPILADEDRPSSRLERLGPSALSNTELLAVVIGRRGTSDSEVGIADRLAIWSEGSLHVLARASTEELTSVSGIGPVVAARIRASLELGRRMMTPALIERPHVTSPADAANLLMGEMMFLEQEHLRVILLNTRNRVLRAPTVYIGSLNTSVIRVGELFRDAIRENAAAIIVAHNHPSGDPTPSPEDVRVTREVAEGGKLLGIDLLDHIIIGHGNFVSLKEQGLGFG